MTFAKIGPGIKRIARDAGDVRGHQVGRELDAAELEVHGLRQRLDDQRLGQSRHTAQQAMPARQKRRQDLGDHLVLSDNHSSQFTLQAAGQRGSVGQAQRLEA
jgi:hypothetical protein